MLEAEQRRRHSILRTYCAAKPGAVERRRWGETVFETDGRVFAFLNPPERPAVTTKVGRMERERFAGHRAVRRARYVGRFGWMTVVVSDHESLRLALELIDRSYELIAARNARRPLSR